MPEIHLKDTHSIGTMTSGKARFENESSLEFECKEEKMPSSHQVLCVCAAWYNVNHEHDSGLELGTRYGSCIVSHCAELVESLRLQF